MNDMSRISAVSDAEAARMVSADTLADLAERITSTAPRAAPATAAPAPVTAAPARPRRRLLIGIPVAACLAAAILIATSLGSPGQKVGPVPVGPAKAQAAALSFTRHGHDIDVTVRNPVADPKIYRAEFAAHHLHLTIQLVPVSPSLVGTLVYMGENSGVTGITTITAKGRCWTGGGGNVCPVGVRVPVGFRGSADFTFGRAARPGEQYESTGPVTAPGEAMHGLSYRGKTVAAVLAMLRARQLTVPQYRYLSADGNVCGTLPHSIPGTWHVYQADPWAPHQVILWVGPAAGTRSPRCSTGNAPGATPTPTPTGR